MVICGYAGVGKSYLAHNFLNVIDLESTPFEKDWDRYFKCAKYYSDQRFLVLLSCHKEIRERVLLMPYEERITINDEDEKFFPKTWVGGGLMLQDADDCSYRIVVTSDYDDEDTNDTPFIILYVHELQHALKLRRINKEIEM